MKISVEYKYAAYCIAVLAAAAGGYYLWRRKKVNDYLEAKSAEKELSEGDGGMRWPCDARTISCGFGPRTAPTSGASTDHKGIDIACPHGSAVYAVEEGEVTGSWLDTTYGGGNSIRIAHENGLTSHYCHLSERLVARGDKVKAGQLIAASGGTPGTEGAGTSTGPHLHFALKNNGVAFDPLTVLSKS